MNGLAAAPDLTAREPRPFGAELEGYAHLPRMLDKARATLAGTNGRYQFGCPVDHTCMARLGVTPSLVLGLAAEHADDHALLDALRAHGVPAPEDCWFDPQAVEDELQAEGTYLRVRHRDELPERDGGRAFTGAEHGAGASVVLVEAPAGEAQDPHTHAVEELMVVQAGTVRYFLGARQARIVGADEVVRVPAGVEHRYETLTAVRAVVVHAGASAG